MPPSIGVESEFDYAGNSIGGATAQSFTVSQASAGTTTALSTIGLTVTYGAEGSETFSGTVTGVTGDGNPQGTVNVTYGSSSALCSSNLAVSGGFAATYSCTLTASQLNAGTYSNVIATYAPTGNVYNPGAQLSPYAALPYYPYLGPYTMGIVNPSGAFSAYLGVSFKLR